MKIFLAVITIILGFLTAPIYASENSISNNATTRSFVDTNTPQLNYSEKAVLKKKKFCTGQQCKNQCRAA